MIRRDAASIERCFLNVSAGLDYYGIGPKSLALYEAARLPDRVLFKPSPTTLWQFAHSLDAMPEKFSTWEYVQNHGVTAVRGWREEVPWCSMQIILHDTGIIEVDYDLCNPNYGVLPAAGHLIEVLWPGKTNPWRIEKGLRKRGVIRG
jgi:hypothetical protein